MTLKEFIDQSKQILKASDSVDVDLQYFIESALGLSAHHIFLQKNLILSDSQIKKLNEFVLRRFQGEPVAYILGEKAFYKNNFVVNKNVLIPRPETELVVEEALSYLQQKKLNQIFLSDFGCGSGCIGLSVLDEVKKAHLTLVDISEAALKVAKINASQLKLLERCVFQLQAVAELQVETKYNVIVANPPYIPEGSLEVGEEVQQYEPHIALFAEENGVTEIKTWGQKAKEMLVEGGFYCFEIGYDQGQAALQIMYSLEAFDQIRLLQDYAGRDRVISAIKI